MRRRSLRSIKKNTLSLNIRTILELVAVVMVWRGVWIILDSYLFPGRPLLSGVIGLVAGIAFLLADDFLLEEIR